MSGSVRKKARAGIFPAFAFFAVLVIVDQLAKAVVRGSIARSTGVEVFGSFQIVHVTNAGAALGFLRGVNLYIALFSMAAVAFLAVIYGRLNNRLQRVASVLIASGIAGNLIDRLSMGAVTDFIYVHPWPAFNTADAFLFAGVALLASSLLMTHRAVKK